MISHHFETCSHLTFFYIIGYNNISRKSHGPTIPLKSVGCDTPPLGLTPMRHRPLTVNNKRCFYAERKHS